MKIVHHPEAGMFEALSDDGIRIGTIRYEADGGDLRATSTWTDPRHRGQGVAGKLLDALVEKARADKVKIVPICSYVVAAFQKAPEKYRDVAKGE